MSNPRKKGQRLGKAKEASVTSTSPVQGGAKAVAQEMAKTQGGKGYGVCFAPTLKEKEVGK